jgi:hypothetical protein
LPGSPLLTVGLGWHHWLKVGLFYSSDPQGDLQYADRLVNQTLSNKNLSLHVARLAYWLHAWLLTVRGITTGPSGKSTKPSRRHHTIVVRPRRAGRAGPGPDRGHERVGQAAMAGDAHPGRATAGAPDRQAAARPPDGAGGRGQRRGPPELRPPVIRPEIDAQAQRVGELKAMPAGDSAGRGGGGGSDDAPYIVILEVGRPDRAPGDRVVQPVLAPRVRVSPR